MQPVTVLYNFGVVFDNIYEMAPHNFGAGTDKTCLVLFFYSKTLSQTPL
jgi:hypothetical protein